MDSSFVGASCALSAAVVWAFAMVLFKKSEKIHPMALNLFKNVVGMILLVATLAVCMAKLGTGWDMIRSITAGDLGILVLSGFLGITLADTLFFYSLNLCGVGIVSIVDCLYSPFIILFSWLYLTEELTLLQYIGATMILAAVLITTQCKPPPNRTRGQLLAGIVLGAVNMALMAIGIVVAKRVLEAYCSPSLEDFSMTLWVTLIRLAAGSVFLTLIILASPRRKALLAVFRPSRDWKLTLPGAVLGGYLAMILWIEGFTHTTASLASILNQTNTLFALILATVFLKESFTKRKAAAMAIALAGIVLVIYHEELLTFFTA
jgi:drug/metabolite transporter (DMT)-like permease